jgi:hypothetical protein
MLLTPEGTEKFWQPEAKLTLVVAAASAVPVDRLAHATHESTSPSPARTSLARRTDTRGTCAALLDGQAAAPASTVDTPAPAVRRHASRICSLLT